MGSVFGSDLVDGSLVVVVSEGCCLGALGTEGGVGAD
jgi:hypothetical protein